MKSDSINKVPGTRSGGQILTYGVIYLLTVSWGVFRYAKRLDEEYRKVMDSSEGTYQALDINELLQGTLSGLTLLMALCVVFAAANYIKLRNDRSIYVLKRIRSRGLQHRMCLTVPIAAALVGISVSVLVLLACVAMYYNAIPAENMPAFDGIDIWRVIS